MPHERRFAEASPFFIVTAEQKAVQEFWTTADRVGLAIPEDSQVVRSQSRVASLMAGPDPIDPIWPPLELLSIVAMAQHYGVPTRLLDWSWKPNVAAYFAAQPCGNDPDPDRLAVWALQTELVKLSNLRHAGEIARVEIVTAPQATNPNLAAQAGLFTLDREHFAEPFDDVLTSIESSEERSCQFAG